MCSVRLATSPKVTHLAVNCKRRIIIYKDRYAVLRTQLEILIRTDVLAVSGVQQQQAESRETKSRGVLFGRRLAAN